MSSWPGDRSVPEHFAHRDRARCATSLILLARRDGQDHARPIIARMTRRTSRALGGLGRVKDVRAVIDQARERLKLSGQRTVLFIDEIHRFRSPEDALLHAVEDRLIVLIGATPRTHSSR